MTSFILIYIEAKSRNYNNISLLNIVLEILCGECL